jgi:hypothetical protein
MLAKPIKKTHTCPRYGIWTNRRGEKARVELNMAANKKARIQVEAQGFDTHLILQGVSYINSYHITFFLNLSYMMFEI